MRSHEVISLDIPTGIESNTGKNLGRINPIATLTLAWPKTGLMELSEEDMGRLFLADISVPSFVFHQQSLFENTQPPSSAEIATVYHYFHQNSLIEIDFNPEGWTIYDHERTSD